jgi:hypothetical protein
LKKIEILRFFVKDQERLERIIKWYIHNKNLYSKGNSEASFFKSLVNAQVYVVWWLGLKSVVPDFPLVLFVCAVPVIVILKIGIHWMIGRWWDRNNFYDRESDWSNKRNPVMNGLDKKVLGGK